MIPTDALQLNALLRQELVTGFKQLFREIVGRDNLPAEVKVVLKTIQQTDLAACSAKIAAIIAKEAIPFWQKEFLDHPEERPQLINFEWNDGDYRNIEAFSYGITGLTSTNNSTLPLFEDPGWDYDFYYEMEAAYGFDFFFFELLEAYLPYDKYGESLYDEDTPLGYAYDRLRQLIPILNELLAHDAFMALDKAGALNNLDLPTGFPFSLGVHDGGNLIRPFYVKA